MDSEKESDRWVWAYRWVMMSLMTLVVAVFTWFFSQLWDGQRKISDRLNAIDVNSATVNASRFTSDNWTVAKDIIDRRFNINEQRIFKVENTLEQIGKDITEIKQNTKRPP